MSTAEAILRELVAAEDDARKASFAFNEEMRRNPGKTFSFHVPSPESLRIEAAWSAARQHIAGVRGNEGDDEPADCQPGGHEIDSEVGGCRKCFAALGSTGTAGVSLYSEAESRRHADDQRRLRIQRPV